MYKANEKDIKNELKALGFDTSYFNIDMTDAFDIATLTFELKRAMLYNTNNSVIEQDLYNLLYRWLHTPMSDRADDTVFIGNFNTGVKRLRKHTNYDLEEFERSLPSIELKKQYTDFIFYFFNKKWCFRRYFCTCFYRFGHELAIANFYFSVPFSSIVFVL